MRIEPENRISFFDPSGFEPFPQQRQPRILLGIQRDICSPMTFGNARLQRMRIIVIEPDQWEEFAGAGSDDQAEVLPLLPPSWALSRHPRNHPRPVLGEILRGENGSFFERFGNRIRPLAQLVAGPHGELLEVPSTADLPALRAPAPPPSGNEPVPEPESHTAASSPPLAPGQPDTAFRPLFPERGQWRVVQLRHFKSMLVPQLLHPERLRDSHRLPCYVQVFEMASPQHLETLANAIFGDASATSQLRPLTAAIIQQLQLGPLLPAPAHRPRLTHRPPGLLLPLDRVLYLEVAKDPTDDTYDTQPKEPASTTHEVHRSRSSRGDEAQTSRDSACTAAPTTELKEPCANLATPSPLPACTSVRNDASAGKSEIENRKSELNQGVKTTIPAQFLKPWEFHSSREEALYEMSRAWSFTGKLRALLRRLTGGLVFSSEFRRWQVMLAGKSLEEQLWAVRPPKAALTHPLIRAWAQRTLELARYHPHAMLMEWEIFWRRKRA